MEHKQYVYIISVLNYFAICISNLTMQLQYLNQDKIYIYQGINNGNGV